MLEMLLKQMGFDPDDFKAKAALIMQKVETFDKRLENIEKALKIHDEPFTDHANPPA